MSATLDCPDWDLETIVAGGAAGFDGVGLRGLRATSILQLVRSSRQACRLPKRTDPLKVSYRPFADVFWVYYLRRFRANERLEHEDFGGLTR